MWHPRAGAQPEHHFNESNLFMLAFVRTGSLNIVCVRVYVCVVLYATLEATHVVRRIVCMLFFFVRTCARTCFIQLDDSVGDVSGHEWLSNVGKRDWCNGASTQICVSLLAENAMNLFIGNPEPGRIQSCVRKRLEVMRFKRWFDKKRI